MTAGIFQPNPFDWLWGGGVGTNIGASIIWVVLVGLVTVVVYPRLRRWLEREVLSHLHAIRAHAAHQTRIVEDHFHRAFGERHPNHGAVDHLTEETPDG